MKSDIGDCEASSVAAHTVTNYIFTELQLPIHHTAYSKNACTNNNTHCIGLDWIEPTTHLHKFAPTQCINSFITFSLFSLILKRHEARRGAGIFLTVLFQHTTMIPDTQNNTSQLFLHFHPAK